METTPYVLILPRKGIREGEEIRRKGRGRGRGGKSDTMILQGSYRYNLEKNLRKYMQNLWKLYSLGNNMHSVKNIIVS